MPPKASERKSDTRLPTLPNKFDGTPSKLNAFLFDCKMHAFNNENLTDKDRTRMITAALTGAAHSIGMVATDFGNTIDNPQAIIDALKNNIPTGSIAEEARMTFDAIKQGPQETGTQFISRFTAALRHFESATGDKQPPSSVLNDLKRRLQPGYQDELIRTTLPNDKNLHFDAACAVLRKYDDLIRLRRNRTTDNASALHAKDSINAIRSNKFNNREPYRTSTHDTCPNCGHDLTQRFCHLHGPGDHDSSECQKLYEERQIYMTQRQRYNARTHERINHRRH